MERKGEENRKETLLEFIKEQSKGRKEKRESEKWKGEYWESPQIHEWENGGEKKKKRRNIHHQRNY